ncbi:MAG TPA: 16S rRNA (cytosine(1402)-N(4))-methyltransferase RsmH [Gemmatimonadaceae bacterium]|nr:16S rRNA (cytosine(1402)-N(4))-methyltransferase RsmH [Gemmatimonadaceae bacterium]
MTALRTHESRWASAYHAPVLATEVADLLRGCAHVLDGTLGGGGHALLLLEQGVRVTALDRDPEAVAAARARLQDYERSSRFRALLGNYADVEAIPELTSSRFDGILLDLGVSSHQLDDPRRGFSFREGAPLDMRMGEDAPLTAAAWLNETPELELLRVFREYGDEPRAPRLAREVVRRRANRPFEISDDFVGAIRGALGPRSGPPDFARLFQAIRIEINDELRGLAQALPRLRDHLEPGGTMVVISYHSGEDRIVKTMFREWSTDCICPPRQPVCTCRGRALGELVTRRSITASPAEVVGNPRARSARLRAWRSAE